MSDAVGSTYNNGGTTTNLTTSFQNVNMGVTVDTPLTGLLSSNDGIFQNNTGSAITINGRLMSTPYGTGTSVMGLFAAATSSDKITWTEQDSSAWGTYNYFSRRAGFCFDYKIEVPAGHYFAVRAKVDSGTMAFQATWTCHHVFSEEGLAETPKLQITTSSSYLNTYTSSGGATYVNIPTTVFGGSVGATSNGASRITNTSGETVTVDGFYNFRISGNDLIALSKYLQPLKNGSAIPDKASYSVSTSYNDQHTGMVWYSVELANNDWIDFYQTTSGGWNGYRTRYFFVQHTMRSRT